MRDSDGITIQTRYQVLSRLGAGGMGIVYQVLDRLTHQTAALKSIITPGNLSSAGGNPRINETRLALTNEFRILAALQHPHIIRVLDYGFDTEQNPFFTMNFIEGARSVTTAGEGQPLEVKIRYITEMLQALAYLHQHEIIHRDLKPDNALVTTDGEVKVLDFGLAVLRQQTLPQNDVSGTLPYIAPETFMGAPASTAADLYTVGVIAYELLAGRYPFDLEDPGLLIDDILYTPPDLNFLEVNDALRQIMAKLLEKSPAKRYSTAHDVLDALRGTSPSVIEIETPAIRESFLQSAKFVGRERELALLVAALKEITDGHGSTWLIGGESGIGKSRLLQELRVHALVEGFLVLQGQAVQGSGLAYHLWREPLRRLILTTELNDTDASILYQMMPDIGELLRREVMQAPELDGQQGQQRLLSTIVSLFVQQKQPILLILEDLEWAEDSLEVLKQLLPVVPTLPLLVVGSYRQEEMPTLPELLNGANTIRLERLTDKGIAELSASMLGDMSEHPEVLELLSRETEGNAFFLVEVVRALSEEAGGLSAITRMALPEHVLTTGVEQVVLNRLKRMPQEAQPLLNIAAVIGRQLDLSLLQQIDTSANLEEWLTVCSNAAVLDVLDQQWRFAHDRLREAILNNLTNEYKQQLHVQAAAALQTAYVDSIDEYAARIADHYEAADKPELALPWCVRAGRHADSTYAPNVAIVYFRKSLMLWDHGGEQGAAGIQLVELYERLGELLNWSARYSEAIELFQEMLKIGEPSGDKVIQARAWHGTARAQTYQGAMRSALESAGRAEAFARAAESPVLVADTTWMTGWIHFQLGNLPAARERAEQVLHLCQHHDVGRLLGNTYNLLGVIQIASGEYIEAARSFQHALEIFQDLGERLHAMTIVNNLGWLAEVRGDNDLAAARYEEALMLARKYGHRNAEIVYLSNLGSARVLRGEFGSGETDLRRVIAMAGESQPGMLSETYNYLAQVCLQQGKVDEALLTAQHALHLGQKVNSQDYIAAAWRVLGMVAIEWLVQMPIQLSESEPAQHFDARGCFTESLRTGEQGASPSEKAKTLRTWARYEMRQGNTALAKAMWEEAHSIFVAVGADVEAARMSNSPPT